MSDFVVSIIRTLTPMVVGSFVGWLTSKGIDAGDVAGVTSFLVAVFSGLYYLIARTLEQRYPQLGWLLGSAKKPEYAKPEGN